MWKKKKRENGLELIQNSIIEKTNPSSKANKKGMN